MSTAVENPASGAAPEPAANWSVRLQGARLLALCIGAAEAGAHEPFPRAGGMGTPGVGGDRWSREEDEA
jgi:hypothetical protein